MSESLVRGSLENSLEKIRDSHRASPGHIDLTEGELKWGQAFSLPPGFRPALDKLNPVALWYDKLKLVPLVHAFRTKAASNAPFSSR